MKKAKGFKSLNTKTTVIGIERLEKKFKDDSEISKETLVKSGIINNLEAKGKIKILGKADIKHKFKINKDILVSLSSKTSIKKAGGEIEAEKKSK